MGKVKMLNAPKKSKGVVEEMVNIAMGEVKLPPFVWFTDGKNKTAMRLIESGDHKEYYRDGGDWATGFTIQKDGSLISSGHSGTLSYLNGKKLIRCTKAEWKKDNGQYAPKL